MMPLGMGPRKRWGPMCRSIRSLRIGSCSLRINRIRRPYPILTMPRGIIARVAKLWPLLMAMIILSAGRSLRSLMPGIRRRNYWRCIPIISGSINPFIWRSAPVLITPLGLRRWGPIGIIVSSPPRIWGLFMSISIGELISEILRIIEGNTLLLLMTLPLWCPYWRWPLIGSSISQNWPMYMMQARDIITSRLRQKLRLETLRRQREDANTLKSCIKWISKQS